MGGDAFDTAGTGSSSQQRSVLALNGRRVAYGANASSASSSNRSNVTGNLAVGITWEGPSKAHKVNADSSKQSSWCRTMFSNAGVKESSFRDTKRNNKKMPMPTIPMWTVCTVSYNADTGRFSFAVEGERTVSAPLPSTAVESVDHNSLSFFISG